MCTHHSLDSDHRGLSTADIVSMIERIESSECLYHDLVQDVKERLQKELDYRILLLVRSSDRMIERKQMGKFRKKPVVIEAVQWTSKNTQEVTEFCPQAEFYGYNNSYLINTLEGVMEAKPGDWIIKGIKNEFYPCKNDIFLASYEVIEE